MKKRNSLILAFCLTTFVLSLRAQPLQYTLLSESRFMDDCLICGRPTVSVPLRGTFTLVPDGITPLFAKYRLENIVWTGGFGTNIQYDIRGNGTYNVGGEVAVTRRMVLNLTVNGRDVVFTNALSNLGGYPDYVIETSLAQTQQNLLTFYTMDLLATPLREAWFSVNRAAPTLQPVAGPGDLLSTSGEIVKSNRELVGRLGLMPVVGHVGIDGVEIMPGGHIWFSLNNRQFSETLGEINEGDIVSAEGAIVRKYHTLIGPFFRPTPPTLPPDPGLDALHVSESGKVLFSVRSNFFSTALGANISRGDLLSDGGQIFRSNAQLLQRFQPVTARDYGLDAIYVWPSGEIWFSTEEDFVDQQRGTIQGGDILSDAGYIAFRNQDLLVKFPTGTDQDLGVDGLFVVTDLSVAAPPRFTGISRTKRLQWQGAGRVFQVEKAAKVTGPYLSATPIIPDTDWMDSPLGNAPMTGFYRLRQW